MLKPYLIIKNTASKGKGVFTKASIPADTVIEEAPVIVMPGIDRKLLDQTLLHDYIFEWGEEKDKCAMALGYIPIYNHSYQSNCEYFMHFEEAIMYVKTVRKIEVGEELTLNYNGDWDNEEKVWFEAE